MLMLAAVLRLSPGWPLPVSVLAVAVLPALSLTLALTLMLPSVRPDRLAGLAVQLPLLSTVAVLLAVWPWLSVKVTVTVWPASTLPVLPLTTTAVLSALL